MTGNLIVLSRELLLHMLWPLLFAIAGLFPGLKSCLNCLKKWIGMLLNCLRTSPVNRNRSEIMSCSVIAFQFCLKMWAWNICSGLVIHTVLWVQALLIIFWNLLVKLSQRQNQHDKQYQEVQSLEQSWGKFLLWEPNSKNLWFSFNKSYVYRLFFQ